jgi:choline dehydrogenase-like flavoprotein
MDRYDVIIVGTGAGGGTLAAALAPTGKKILLLERGDWIPREKQNWDPREAITRARYHAREAWYDAGGRAFHPGTHYNVGGNTKFYGAALWRMREADFGELKHHGGVSPAWPLDYADFEPWYAAAEQMYRVHGQRGTDPTEPWASGPFPAPAVSHEPRIQRLHDELTQCGYKPFPSPVGVLLDEARPWASACIRCGTCDAFPCLVNAKSDAATLGVLPALRHPNVTLLTRAFAKRLETDAGGRSVTRVVVERDGEELACAGDVVVVSAGAVNSAALLLRSASDRHPDGLANGSGAVGRHYMCHNNSMLNALSREPNPTEFHKTFALNDFYFGDGEYGLPMGSVQLMGKAHPEVLAEGAPRGTPKKILALMASHGLPFWVISEDLPDPENRVRLGDGGRIEIHYRENNLEPHDRLKKKLKQIVSHAGCEEERLIPTNLYIGGKIPIAGVAHQCGTVRFGRDARTSVLDPDCKAHELDNLYVVDASFFPSSSAVNPALTIMANALRVGARLRERLGA